MSFKTSFNMDRDQILSPRTVEGLIADGHTIVIFEDFVLRLDSWLSKHPGGRLPILHMVGKDATDEINAYHSAATLKTLGAYRIGRKPRGPWLNMTPPIRGGVYRRPSVTVIDNQPGTPKASNYKADPSELTVAVTTPPTTPPSSPPTATATLLRLRVPPRKGNEPLTPGTDEWDDRSSYGWESGGEKDNEDRDNEKDNSHGLETDQRDAAAYTEWAVQQNVRRDLQDYPSVDLSMQQDIVHRYRLLHQQIQDEGLYECRYLEYGKEMIRYVSLFALFLFTLHNAWYMTSAISLGLFWHQIMFTAHDAGHRAITQKFVPDTLIGMFVADFCCGLSIGWWKSSHNVHHLVTNSPDHDPDIQNVPLFATCPSFFRSIHSTYYDFKFAWDAAADFLVPYQKYTYYPVMGIARFNLYLLSWLHVLSSKSSSLGHSKAWWIRPTEILFMACYWFLFGYCLLWRTLPSWTIRVAFVLVSHVITMPLHVQITLSHWGMSTSDLGESESFPQRQLRTTMDVDCPAWLDFIHGGLQFQTVHHLFPRVPRHNLRRVQELGLQFSKDTGIPYTIMKFVDGNKKVLGHLGDIGNQVRILVECQKYMAKTGESGLH